MIPFTFLQTVLILGTLGTVGILTVAIADTEDDGGDATTKSDDGELVDRFDARKERAKFRLEDRIQLSENSEGDISLSTDTDGIQEYDRQAMLYVFGK